MIKNAVLLGSLMLLIFAGTCFGAPAGSENVTWSSPVDGLAISLRIPNNRLAPMTAVEIQLGFRNVTDKPLRVYLVQGYFFRSFQCMFYLKTPSDSAVLGRPSPPHGYVVTEADFPLIPAKGESWFAHTLQYKPERIKEFASQTELTWKYSNTVDEWKGGDRTMEGVTKDLFDGKKIPYIWKGEISVTQPLAVP